MSCVFKFFNDIFRNINELVLPNTTIWCMITTNWLKLEKIKRVKDLIDWCTVFKVYCCNKRYYILLQHSLKFVD